jgi:hypothetical protein
VSSRNRRKQNTHPSQNGCLVPFCPAIAPLRPSDQEVAAQHQVSAGCTMRSANVQFRTGTRSNTYASPTLEIYYTAASRSGALADGGPCLCSCITPLLDLSATPNFCPLEPKHKYARYVARLPPARADITVVTCIRPICCAAATGAGRYNRGDLHTPRWEECLVRVHSFPRLVHNHNHEQSQKPP